jgi:uncharacterized protein YciI
MKEKDQLFVRLDNKAVMEKPSIDIFNKHIEYLNKISQRSEFYGGGFSNNPGGMIIFKASSFDHAKEICDNDPIIKSGFYKYTLYNWEIVICNNC